MTVWRMRERRRCTDGRGVPSTTGEDMESTITLRRVGFWGVLVAACAVMPLRVSAILPTCVADGADLVITVDNQTGASQDVTFNGTLLTKWCDGGTASFRQTVTCAVGLTDCVTVTGLDSGIWTHQISVGSQKQYTKSVVVADGPPNTVSWVAFKTVLSVDRTDDISNPPARCPSAPGKHTCTLREAMSAGATAPAPLLVQFDSAVFPAGSSRTIQLTQPFGLPIAGDRMMVDGTDPTGNPTFSGDPYRRIVKLPSAGAAFVFTNQLAVLVGLFIQRPILADGAAPGDVVIFTGSSAQQNLVSNCRIDGGGKQLTTKSVGQDCIQGINGAGRDWSGANLVENTELTACPDKGVKATTLAYLKVQDSWVHHNIGGGIQATLSGNIEADRNLIERNGYNARAQVFLAANGVSANGADAGTPDTPSVVQTNGNVMRDNSSRGISVGELSTATITNDASCGATNGGLGGQNGIAIFNSTADPAAATVRGTTTVYNGRNGATIDDQSSGDFGQNDPDGGHNAFTQNATNVGLGGHNFDNSSTQVNVPARGNQWQRCYADAVHPGATCDGDLSLDVSGSVNAAAPQPYWDDAVALPVMLQSFWPAKAKANDWVRITGSGFDAVTAYPRGGSCTSVPAYNACGKRIQGNCVEYEDSPGVWKQLPVHSVTPTHIVVKLPPTFRCAQPVSVRLRRLDHTGAVVMGTGTFCTNS
jgi:hypothetical protein